jgi:uncharacterized protein
VVVDTGVLLAALDRSDPRHDASRGVLDDPGSGPLFVPAPVLNELDHFMRKRGIADRWLTFCEDVAEGRYALHPLNPASLLEAAKLQSKYQDLRLGFVDATVFQTCVELGERTVATLDRRHFSVLRTPEGQALEIVPE